MQQSTIPPIAKLTTPSYLAPGCFSLSACGRFAAVSCALLCFVAPIATGTPWQAVESRGHVSQVEDS